MTEMSSSETPSPETPETPVPEPERPNWRRRPVALLIAGLMVVAVSVSLAVAARDDGSSRSPQAAR
jgi:hypothetical protein